MARNNKFVSKMLRSRYSTIYTGSCVYCDKWLLTYFPPWGYMWKDHKGPYCSSKCSGYDSSSKDGCIDTQGYRIIHVRGKIHKQHRYITKCPKNKVVHHINHDRKDNNPGNLLVVSSIENHKLNAYIWPYIRSEIGTKKLRRFTILALRRIRNGR